MKPFVKFKGRCLGAGGPIVCFVALLMLPVTGLQAQPNDAVHFLMKSPVSMLDWGFKNIENYLIQHQAFLTAGENDLFAKTVAASVDYDWSQDTIRITVGLSLLEKTQKTMLTLQGVQAQAAFVVTYLRGGLTLNPYEAFFRHKGFRQRETPENLEAKLAAVTELVVVVRDTERNILGTCKAPLLGDAIEWLKIGEN